MDEHSYGARWPVGSIIRALAAHYIIVKVDKEGYATQIRGENSGQLIYGPWPTVRFTLVTRGVLETAEDMDAMYG